MSQSTAEVSEMLSAYSADSAQAAKDMATYCLVLKRLVRRRLQQVALLESPERVLCVLCAVSERAWSAGALGLLHVRLIVCDL